MKELTKQQHLVQELKATTEKQAARIALQEGQIKALNAGQKQQAEQIQKVNAQQQKETQALVATVKEQASQIQKVIAQIELTQTASQTVLNNR